MRVSRHELSLGLERQKIGDYFHYVFTSIIYDTGEVYNLYKLDISLKLTLDKS